MNKHSLPDAIRNSASEILRNVGGVASLSRAHSLIDRNDLQYLQQNSKSNGQLKQEWEKVTSAVVSMFEQKRLSDMEIPRLQSKVMKLVSSKAGAFVYDYYTDHIMKRCMGVFCDELADLNGVEFMRHLVEMWDFLYSDLLPLIQLIFLPIEARELTLKQATFRAFRDYCLLSEQVFSKLQSAIQDKDILKPFQVKQMLLTIQSIAVRLPVNEKTLQMESIVALWVSPLLGVSGLYIDGQLVTNELSDSKNSIVSPDEASPKEVKEVKTEVKEEKILLRNGSKKSHIRQISAFHFQPEKLSDNGDIRKHAQSFIAS